MLIYSMLKSHRKFEDKTKGIKETELMISELFKGFKLLIHCIKPAEYKQVNGLLK